MIKEKVFMEENMGVDRSTFIISQDGKILYAWRNVKVKGHVDEVIEKLREYQ